MAYTIHQAKTHLSRLVKEAEAGNEVVVMRGKKPVAKIVPVNMPATEELPFRLIGAFRGKIHYDDSVFKPATDAELAEMGFVDLLEGDLVPPPGKP
jgi:prevent-host-death family protein